MTQAELIDKLITDNGGMIRTSQVTEAGITKPVFYQYVKENNLEQIAHGVYATSDSWTDAMYLLHLRCKQAVFSHETALFLHDLTDREPTEYEITVKTGYNPSKLKNDGIKVYTVKKEFHEKGIIMMQTLQTALKQYSKRKDKNLRLVMQHAKDFRVERILRQYLEVLL